MSLRVLALVAGWRLDLRLACARAVDAVRRMPMLAARDLRWWRSLVAVAGLAMVLGLGAAFALRWAGAERHAAAGTPALDPPAAVPANGEYVRSRVLASGDVDVDHWIRSTRALSAVTLSVPSATGRIRGGPLARDVRVESDQGRRLGADILRSGKRTFPVDDAALVHVSYVLSGVVERSSSVRERALARVTSLDVSYRHDDVPKILVMQGGRLLAAACSRPAPETEPRPCGEPDGLGWRVRLSPAMRDDRVMAQLDLP